MRRYGMVGIAILLAAVLASCDGSPAQKAARIETGTSHPTSPTSVSTSTTTRTIPPFQPSEVAHLGGTLPFTAQLSGSPNAALRITLDSVIDPGPPGSGQEIPTAGTRNVELRVTLTNDGDATVPVLNEGDEYILTMQWQLDVDIAYGDGVPIYQYEGPPSATSSGAGTDFPQPGITPGQSVTGCVLFFDISDGSTVHNATALLLYAGIYNGAPGEWLIP
jgi:hypothetical protein